LSGRARFPTKLGVGSVRPALNFRGPGGTAVPASLGDANWGGCADPGSSWGTELWLHNAGQATSFWLARIVLHAIDPIYQDRPKPESKRPKIGVVLWSCKLVAGARIGYLPAQGGEMEIQTCASWKSPLSRGKSKFLTSIRCIEPASARPSLCGPSKQYGCLHTCVAPTIQRRATFSFVPFGIGGTRQG
jgi:hypothetical protein